ncbi:MAG: PhoH family protein [Polyangiales bacterium]
MSDAKNTEAEGAASADVEVSDVDVLLRLTGPNSAHLRVLEDELEVSLGLRGNTIRIVGEAARVAEVETFLAELAFVMQKKSLPIQELKRAARTAIDHPGVRLRDLVNDVVLRTSSKRAIAPKSVAQQAYIQTVESQDVVFGIGPAGTGKTYLAMAMAVAALTEKRAKRIILTRPAVEAGEKLGFLPGDLTEKVNPYLRPLYDALHDMVGEEKANVLIDRGTIEVAPLAFMRGRTLNDAFVILDEAQNTTPNQMKMFLTRLGFRSQAVITGDITQLDLPNGQSGLRDAERLLKNVEGIGFCYFTEVDVVRHPLVRRIIRAYDERDSKRRAEREARERPES